jgi:hypothetical protein
MVIPRAMRADLSPERDRCLLAAVACTFIATPERDARVITEDSARSRNDTKEGKLISSAAAPTYDVWRVTPG